MSVTQSDIWTIRKVMAWSTHFLRDKGSPTARLDAELLLAEALSCSRIELYTNHDKPLGPDEKTRYRDYVGRRGKGEPVAYILGRKGFWKYDFKVTPATLIPRSDTELLIETVLAEVKKRDLTTGKILDVGTGSGCIALSLAKELPEFSVEAWDVDEKSLVVARENAQELGAENADFLEVDGLDYNVWGVGDMFDIIVSNPPYIRRDEEESLPKSVINFEPPLALFADADGLEFYELFAEYAAKRLKRSGLLAVEVGISQADKVAAVFQEQGWSLLGVHPDLAGVDRVVVVGPPAGGESS